MENKPFRMFWGSSYDRGLQYLLQMWPQVLEKIPTAELHICYGWNLFDKAYANNPYMMNWKTLMLEMMKRKGITEYGRVSKEEVNKITEKCDVWAYYCTFSETNCITALNCQKLGVVPITMNRAGLMDTVYSGIKIEEDGDDPEAKAKYLESLVFAYENPAWLEEQKQKAKEGIEKYYWENISAEWSKLF